MNEVRDGMQSFYSGGPDGTGVIRDGMQSFYSGGPDEAAAVADGMQRFYSVATGAGDTVEKRDPMQRFYLQPIDPGPANDSLIVAPPSSLEESSPS